MLRVGILGSVLFLLLYTGCSDSPSEPLPAKHAQISSDTFWEGNISVGGIGAETLMVVSGLGNEILEFPELPETTEDVSYCAQRKKLDPEGTLRFRVIILTNREEDISGAWIEAVEPNMVFRACNFDRE